MATPVIQILLIYCVLYLPSAENTTCNNTYYDITTNKKINDITSYCANATCIQKCCGGKDELMYYNRSNAILKCVHIDYIRNLTKDKHFQNNFSSLLVYGNNYHKNGLIKTGRRFKHTFKLIYNSIFNPECNSTDRVTRSADHDYFILENGKLVQHYFNRFYPYYELPMDSFCADETFYFAKTKPKLTRILEKVKLISNDETIVNLGGEFIMMISAIFLAITLIIRVSIKPDTTNHNRVIELVQNTFIFMWMCVMFFTSLYQLIRLHLNTTGVIWISVTKYFVTLSGFFWMNVLSLDMLMTIGTSRKRKDSRHQAMPMKFRWYCLYAFGVPCIMTIMAYCIDLINPKKNKYIVKIFFKTGLFTSSTAIELKIYLYIPMGILLTANVIFFLLSADAVCSSKKSTRTVLAKKKKDKDVEQNETNNRETMKVNTDRFFMYVKLSLLMGLNWIFEAASLSPGWLDYIMTIYNSLTGVFIFLCFVCNKKTFVALCDRLGVKGSYVDRMRSVKKPEQSADGARKKRVDYVRPTPLF